MLLADDAVGGTLGRQDRADRGFGLPVGDRDRRAVGLVVHREGRAVIAPDHRTGGIGQTGGQMVDHIDPAEAAGGSVEELDAVIISNPGRQEGKAS